MQNTSPRSLRENGPNFVLHNRRTSRGKGKYMTDKYIPKQFEGKLREEWKREKISNFPALPAGRQFLISNKTPNSKSQFKKYYSLVELPYTSGDLHIGHWFTFTAPDVLSR